MRTKVSSSIERFARARKGTAAVEFAMIAPVALLLYVGTSEVGDGVIASRRATTVARRWST